MSVENGERFVRLLQDDTQLREAVRTQGAEKFEEIAAAAGASCTTFEVVVALLRQIDQGSS